MSKVSIYCFHHPPHKGVGGRRWREFAIRLSQRGYDVSVTCAPVYESGAPDSLDGVRLRYLQRSRMRRFPFRETRVFLRPLWILQRFFWRFRKKGFVDQTDGLLPSIRREVKQDLANGVHHIIVSCAPFHWALHVGRVLLDFDASDRPQFIVDFRDPWSSNDIAYFNHISDDERYLEANREEEVWQLADKVLLVEEKIALPRNLSLRKHFVLPNGAKMTPLVRRERQELGSVVKAVYFGSLYSGCLENFVSCLQAVNKSCIAMGKGFECRIGGRWTRLELDRIADLEFCEYHGMLPRDTMREFWNEANFGISIIPDSMPYAINTKILECVSIGKPVCVIAKNGSAADFLTKNRLGIVWDPAVGTSKNESLEEWIFEGCPIGPGDGHMLYDLDCLVDSLEDELRQA